MAIQSVKPTPLQFQGNSGELPEKVFRDLEEALNHWEMAFGGVAGEHVGNLVTGLRGDGPGQPWAGQIKAAATRLLENWFQARLGMHLVDPADVEIANLLLELGGEKPKALHVCSACSWVFEASRPRALCDRCGKRPKPPTIDTAEYAAIPLPRYRDGQPHEWRISRIGLCHECGRTILPDEMGKSNKKTCGLSCRKDRSRRRKEGGGDWHPEALEELRELEHVRSAAGASYPTAEEAGGIGEHLVTAVLAFRALPEGIRKGFLDAGDCSPSVRQ